MLSRLATPCLPQSRAFSTSAVLRFNASAALFEDEAPRRVNPLIGNLYRMQPPKPEEPKVKVREIPTSTEHPRATQPPRPSRAPTSSAEVPPNADIPPPPPRASSAPVPEAKPTASPHPYNATNNFINLANIIASKATSWGEDHSSDPQTRPNVRAKAVTGRTIFLGSRPSPNTATTATHALKMLNRLVSQQKVKNKARQQKFHERPGLKRKRLRSERWRSRFKTGFKATVSRVLELKRQGW